MSRVRPFYGGYEFIAYDAAAPTQETKDGVTDPNGAGGVADPDVLSFIGRYNADHDATVDSGEAAGVILLATDSSTTLGAGSTFTLTLGDASSPSDGSLTGRMVILSNGSYFISADTFAYTTNGTPQLTLTGGTQFYAYDPATALNFDQGSPGSPVTGVFTNVTAVGFYFENDNITSASFSNTYNADARTGVSSVIVDAIPEPASLAMLAMGGLLLRMRRRS